MRLLVAFTLAVIAIVAVAAATLASLGSWKSSNDMVTHSHQVREALDRALLAALDAESAERGYLLTGRDEYLPQYEAGRAATQAALGDVGQLTMDNPVQQRQLPLLRHALTQRMDKLALGISMRREGARPGPEIVGVMAEGKELMDRARVVERAMVAEEERLLAERQEHWVLQQRRGMLISVLGAALLLLFALGAAALVRDDLRRRDEAARQRALVYGYQEHLVAIVGHDLRNPLTALLATVKHRLTKRDALAPELIKDLERVLRSATRIQALSELLVDYTRARLGRGLPAHKAPADARTIVERVAEEVRASNPSSAVQIDVRSGNTGGMWDGERISQAVSNLATNAVRYGRRDAPVRIAVADAANDCVEIRVHNEGMPIEREKIPVLFEPYHRGPAGDDSTPGLGLGLYIAREIVRAHGGEIEVESTEAKGTSFTVRLPRREPAGAAEATASDTPGVESGGTGVIIRRTAAAQPC